MEDTPLGMATLATEIQFAVPGNVAFVKAKVEVRGTAPGMFATQ